MQKNKYYLLLYFTFLLACKQDIKDTNLESNNFFDLKSLIITKGDTNAYNTILRRNSLNTTRPELLYYSQIMCNKYNYSPACLECFYINCEIGNPKNIKSNDSFNYKLGLFYLFKAKELGNISSLYYLHSFKSILDINSNSSSFLKKIIE
jgi:hypothetical protein